jgi:hypothetical protein
MRWKWRLALAGSILAALGATGCGTVAYSPTAAGQSLPQSSGPLTGPAGAAGSAVWALEDGDVVLSDGYGSAWSVLRLPAGVPARSVAAVATAPGRDVWVAEPVQSGATLFHRSATGAAGWSATKLIARSAPARPPDQLVISVGTSATVTVLEVWELSPLTSAARLFVSPNNGRSFTQLPAPNIALPYMALTWWDAAFVSRADGVALVGASRNYVLHTTNGGLTWSRSGLVGVPGGEYVGLGDPMANGANIELPVFAASPASTGKETFTLYVSRNGGATFSQSSRPVTVTASTVPGTVPVAVDGSTIWLLPAPGSELIRSDNNGATWRTTSLPFRFAADIGSASSASATVVAGGTITCTGSKSHGSCTEQPVEVWKTSDDGSAWQEVSPGTAAS